MCANSEEIVLQIRDQFEGLLQMVCNTQAQNTPTAYEAHCLTENTTIGRLLPH